MKKKLLPLNLQFFAEPEGEPDQAGEGVQNQPAAGTQNQALQFDYEKLASIISGRQSAAEDTVLKNYFKQQGLSKEEMDQAISAFKQQKADSQPDIGALQTQIVQAQQATQQALIEKEAYLLSGEIGVDLKTMPFLLKMADLSAVVGTDGKVNQNNLKDALNKVLEAVPQLKPQANAPQSGFRQIGVENQQQPVTNHNESPAVPTKKWNRWNN